MNYYEHHIGDYAEATAHLTFVEDAAYSRMIRKYYATERPLPADIQEVQRLMRARTKAEKTAVETILHEFFTLEEDGWHNARCDEELARYRGEKPPGKETKEDRVGRYREEKRRLLSELEEHGVMLPFNTPIEVVRTKHKETVTCNADVTPLKRIETLHETENETHETLHVTAIHNPEANNQTPKPPVTPLAGNVTCNADVTPGNVSTVTQETAVALSVSLRKAGINANAANPQIIALAEQGVDVPTVLAAVDEAKKSKPNERIALGYIVKILERWAADAKKIQVRGADKRDPPDNWWTSNEGIDRKGRELGLKPRPIESYPEYKTRIFDVLRERREAVA